VRRWKKKKKNLIEWEDLFIQSVVAIAESGHTTCKSGNESKSGKLQMSLLSGSNEGEKGSGAL